MRYLIECSYRGKAFHGWQIQPNAISVQESIEKALSTVLKQKIEIVGSSRTDTGVHASQQFAHFDVEEKIIDIDKIAHSINGILSKDIAIKKILAVPNDFHSRFDACHRRYLYRIHQEKNPFWYEMSYFCKTKLDISLMNKAGEIMLKYIDYQCFSKVKTDVQTFNCKIEFAYWEQQEQFLLFHIKADRFLRGMVRAIVGTMIEVGAGKLTLTDFEQIILSKNRNNAGRAVPSEGLTLVEVGYKSL
ncbi:tRNA pseudouridine synthase A [Emticicia aquatica]|jgi:tRNA pseudouridine38-40 synthase|uniref:tRNA pseudouridine synthase A n=1 Tax=Emticicia aquatica TaxID=1681835 RepID=A0ABN8ER30_9BACT|nr:tRNA pseudouridine(38-40) synthase TruA [Emticicia aquatica]CAH0995327.1 tRNA pseudouridine synthase A [Emticicia aquatica]